MAFINIVWKYLSYILFTIHDTCYRFLSFLFFSECSELVYPSSRQVQRDDDATRQPRLRFNLTHYGLRRTLTSDCRVAPKSHARCSISRRGKYRVFMNYATETFTEWSDGMSQSRSCYKIRQFHSRDDPHRDRFARFSPSRFPKDRHDRNIYITNYRISRE